MTKIFCDIADKKLIKKYNKIKIVKGFTTNPTLMRKAGAKDYKSYCEEILKITNKPISFEVLLIMRMRWLIKVLKLIIGEETYT